MCGIFGFTDFKKDDLDKARKSLHTLHHRGPDQWNDYFDKKIYIGHQRLSILDLSLLGKQPMVSEDENVIITVNGEVYNFKVLKNLKEFKKVSDLIIANRMEDELQDVKSKVYTRDLFNFD